MYGFAHILTASHSRIPEILLKSLYQSSFRLLITTLSRRTLILGEPQTDTIHTVPLISGSRVPFPFKDVTKVTPTVAANDLRPLHSQTAIHVSLDSSRDGVKVRRPAASGLEFVVCRVERSVAGRTVVYTLRRVVRIVLAGAGTFGSFLAEDAELLCFHVG